MAKKIKGGGLTGGIDILSMLGSIFSQGQENVKSFDTSQFQNTPITANTTEGLLGQLGSYNPTQVTYNKKNVASEGFEGALSGATSGASLGPWGALGGGILGGLTGIGSSIIGNRENAELAEQRQTELNRQHSNQVLGIASNINNKNFSNLQQNTFADGGNLLTEFNAGGTHEENPNGGIPQGMGANGQENKVEEGEVKYKDFIYSNRIKINKNIAKQFNIPSKLIGKSFADATKYFSKESEERPNDPISKRGLESAMDKLKMAQEQVKSNNIQNAIKNNPELLQQMQQQQGQQPMSESQNTLANGGPLPGSKEWMQNAINSNLFGNVQQQTNEALSGLKDPFDSMESDPNVLLENLKTKVSNITSDKTKPWYDKAAQSMKEYAKPSNLRYAPVIGSGLSAISSMFDTPDYSKADAITRATRNLPTISYSPTGQTMTPKPFDLDYRINQLGSQDAATRRAIATGAGGNRATATAGLLAQSRSFGRNLSELSTQAEQYNQQQRDKALAFNNALAARNQEQAMRADLANLQTATRGVDAATRAAQMKTAEDRMLSQTKSQNLTNLFSNLGAVGTEEFNKNIVNSLQSLGYKIGDDGKVIKKKNQ